MNLQSLQFQINGPFFLTSLVLKEIKSSIARYLLNLTKITVMDPSKISVDLVNSKIIEIGQQGLSQADISILALAVDLKNIGRTVLLLSDDYAIQNVAKYLQIKTKGVKQKKYVKKRSYRYLCSACGYEMTSVKKECDICGTSKFKKIF